MTCKLLHLVALFRPVVLFVCFWHSGRQDNAEACTECCATSAYLRRLKRIVICELDLYSADNTALKSAWHSPAYIKAKLLLACPS